MTFARRPRRPSPALLCCRVSALAVALSFAAAAAPAHALSAEGIAVKALDLMGQYGLAKSNDIELLKFSIKHPNCASTIFEKTVAQDYSLIATAVAMKTAKVGQQVSIQGLKSFNQNSCKALSPLQRFYAFTDLTGDRFLPDVKVLKQLAKQQMDQGKSELEGALAKVPVAGPVLLNWSCLCTAAFETNLSEEALGKTAYQKGAKLVAAATGGNTGNVVEVALGEFGASFACALGAEYSGVGQVPIVGKATASTCSSVLGTAVGWGVKGAGAVAKGVVAGSDAVEKLLFGDDSHMSYDKYYADHWQPTAHAGVANCLATDQKCSGLGKLQKPVWDKCVDYFDTHNQSASTARKTCDDLRDKRHNPMVKEFAKKMQAAAFAHVQALAPFARTMAVGDHGKNQAQPDELFMSNCQVKLRFGFEFPAPQHKVPDPDAWQIACAKAAPSFVALFKQEQAALQQKLAQLAQQGCLPAQDWPPNKGIKLDCASQQAYDACLDGLKAGHEQKLCTLAQKAPVTASASAGGFGGGTAAAGDSAQFPAFGTQRGAPPQGSGGGLVEVPEAAPPPDFSPQRVAPPPVQRGAVRASAQPVLTSEPQLLLQGKPARFGQSAELSDQLTQARANGVCSVAVQHAVRNAGSTAAPAFRTTWEGGAGGPLARSWPALAPGQVSTQTELLALRPGPNVLTLRVQGESASAQQLTVVVHGACQAAVPGRAAAPPAPAGGVLRR